MRIFFNMARNRLGPSWGAVYYLEAIKMPLSTQRIELCCAFAFISITLQPTVAHDAMSEGVVVLSVTGSTRITRREHHMCTITAHAALWHRLVRAEPERFRY